MCYGGAENRTEQSKTDDNEAHTIRISTTVRNKTAKLTRVIYRIAAGAERASVSSSRTRQQGGSTGTWS